MNTRYLKFFVIAVFLIVCSFTTICLNNKIFFESENQYPEGICYDSKRDLLYVSSITTGKIGAVDRKGNFKIACDDPGLISTLGLKYNVKSDRLYALNGDFGMSSKSSSDNILRLCQLAIINPATSKVESFVDLSQLTSGKHLANDLTIDKEGNAYITDSYANVIYKVDAKKNASLFAQSDLFRPDSAKFGINGIAYNEEGFLLVGMTEQGDLLKVSVKDPKQIEKVKLPEALEWVDGIYFINPNELVAVRNRFKKTVFLKSNDHWKSAEIVKEEISGDQMPTTAAVYKNEVFVVNSKMMDMREKKQNKTFVIDVFTK